jgi:hypothetical protein
VTRQQMLAATETVRMSLAELVVQTMPDSDMVRA